MEVLKYFLLSSLLITGGFLFGQTNTEIKSAIIYSLELEEIQEYSNAADTLVAVYDEDSYAMNLRIGWLKYNAGDYNESYKYYQVAMKELPMSVEAKLGATLPLSKLEKWDVVMNLYKEILIIDPNNTTAGYNLGLIYYNRGLLEDACKHFKLLKNLYPTEYNYILMYGWTCLKMGNNNDAKVLFNEVLFLYPDDESALMGLDALK